MFIYFQGDPGLPGPPGGIGGDGTYVPVPGPPGPPGPRVSNCFSNSVIVKLFFRSGFFRLIASNLHLIWLIFELFYKSLPRSRSYHFTNAIKFRAVLCKNIFKAENSFPMRNYAEIR